MLSSAIKVGLSDPMTVKCAAGRARREMGGREKPLEDIYSGICRVDNGVLDW